MLLSLYMELVICHIFEARWRRSPKDIYGDNWTGFLTDQTSFLSINAQCQSTWGNISAVIGANMLANFYSCIPQSLTTKRATNIW